MPPRPPPKRQRNSRRSIRRYTGAVHFLRLTQGRDCKRRAKSFEKDTTCLMSRNFAWMRVVDPQRLPSQWLSLVLQFGFEREHLVTAERRQKLEPRHAGKLCGAAR